jgi:hypothetical protein
VVSEATLKKDKLVFKNNKNDFLKFSEISKQKHGSAITNNNTSACN